jgi:MATE family multidrug resistance protein
MLRATMAGFMKSTLRRIYRLGFPLLAGNLSHYLLHVADAAMVGHLGSGPLAAIAVGGMFAGVLFVMVWPVSAGTQALASRRYGRQQARRADEDDEALTAATGEVLGHAQLVSLLAGLLAFSLSFIAPLVLNLIIADGVLVRGALSYILILRWGLPAVGLAMALRGFLGGINQTRVLMQATLTANGLNILLNYLLIYGRFGFPALGLRGAALGTLIADLFALAYLMLASLKRGIFRAYRPWRRRALKPALLRRISLASLPMAVQNCIALLIMLLFEAMVSRIGTVYLAVTHIVLSFFRINKTIVGGFAQGTAILVGNALGAERHRDAVRVMKACELLGALIGGILLLAALLVPGLLVRIFSGEPEVIAAGIPALRFFAIFFFIEVLGYSFEIVFTENGWGAYVLFSEFLTNVLFILGLTFLLTRVFAFGIYAAWLSFAIYQVMHALILFMGYLNGKWLKVRLD